MPRIYLVRHGQATAGFSEHADPGLTELGRAHAMQAADELRAHGPFRLVSSPLARARETAQPLSTAWSCPIEIDDRVTEIPSPTANLEARSAWLGGVMNQRWSELDVPLQRWARAVVTSLLEQPSDCAVFSHFIAINVAVGWAIGDDRVVHVHPGYASITVLDTDGWHLRLVRAGSEAGTHVN